MLLIGCMMLPVTAGATGVEGKRSGVNIPTAAEIELSYKKAKQGRMVYSPETADINSMTGSEAILFTGVLASYAEEVDDINIFIPVVDELIDNLGANLSAEDFASIISDNSYTDSFRFVMMDVSSYLEDIATVNYASEGREVIDEAMVTVLEPNNELSITAMLSIDDRTLIAESVLLDILQSGTESEQQVALRVLVELYPDTAQTSIISILEDEALEDTMVYSSAINFLPRLVGETRDSSFDEDFVIELIEDKLKNTASEFIQTTCVQALEEMNSEKSAVAIFDNQEMLPVELVDSFAKKNIQLVQDMPEYDEFMRSYDEAETINLRAVPGTSFGNAIYRDGVMGNYEWHAGILAYSGDFQGTTRNTLIHIRGAGGTVRLDNYDAFLAKSSNTFKGRYYIPGESDSTYKEIYYTALDLSNEGIGYTLAVPMSVYSEKSKYHPSDIRNMRCDGVVEYSYEYNGVEVTGGRNAAEEYLWDVSTKYGLWAHEAFPKEQARAMTKI